MEEAVIERDKGSSELDVKLEEGCFENPEHSEQALKHSSHVWIKEEPSIKEEPLDERDMEVNEASDLVGLHFQDEKSAAAKTEHDSARSDIVDVNDEMEHGRSTLQGILCQNLEKTTVNQLNPSANMDVQGPPGAIFTKTKNPEGLKWSDAQTLHLCELVQKKWHIIGGELGPGLSSKDKQVAWADIASVLNAVFSPVTCSPDQCKKHWYKTKEEFKQEMSFWKDSHDEEEGGPQSQSSSSPIRALIPSDLEHESLATGRIGVLNVTQDHLVQQNKRAGGCTTENIMSANEDQPSTYTVADDGDSPSPPLPPKPNVPLSPIDLVRTWSMDESNPRKEKLINETLVSMKKAWDAERDLYKVQQEYSMIKLKKLKRGK